MKIKVDKDQYIALIKEVEELKRKHKVLSEKIESRERISSEAYEAKLRKAVLGVYDAIEGESQKRERIEDVLMRHIDETMPILIEKALAEDKYKDMILAKVVRASIGMDK